jgi:hypothetical protein
VPAKPVFVSVTLAHEAAELEDSAAANQSRRFYRVVQSQ